MLRKLLLPLLFIGLFASSAFAQTGSITGTVTNEDGDPVPTANVLLVEISRGAATNLDGEYTIENVEPGTYTIRVSFIGYGDYTDDVTIVSGQTLEKNVVLLQGTVGLDELVVTGYGQTLKSELTGSISTISTEEIESAPVLNTESLLQGRAAGVTVTTTSGNPGGAFQVNIRGNGSINAASQPLYVIDGVPISFSQQSNLVSQTPLNSISPTDIQSIEIIKGAAASAIYGSQAANGVVLITTKTGQPGGTRVTVRAERGISRATQVVDYINADRYLNYMAEAAAINAGVEPVGAAGFEPGGAYLPYRQDYIDFFTQTAFGSPTGTQADPAGDGATYADTDWQDFIYDEGVTQSYSASVSGGNENTRFYVSGEFEQIDGHIFNSKFDALGLRTNLSHDFSERFTANVKLDVNRSNQFGICQDGNFINCPPSQAMFESPFSFPFYNNGEYSALTGFGLENNPAVIRDEVDRNVQVISIFGSLNMNYELTDWLSLSGMAGVDYRNTEDERYESPIANAGENGSLSYTYRNVYNVIANTTLNARHIFNEVHSLSGFIGTEYRRDYSTRVGVEGIGFPGSFFRVLDVSSTPTSASGTYGEFRVASYFGNVKYDYDSRYFLSLTARYDGHSRFGFENRWGFFPSVSGAWRISEEDFFNVDAISELKLRAGYGVVGNAAIGNYAALGVYSSFGTYLGQATLSPDQLPNPALSWEEAKEINIGLDFGLWNGRVSGTFDIYRRDTDNLLLNRELPVESGYGSITENVGSIRNEGVEFEIQSVNITAGDFFWSTRFNIGLLRNEVTDLGEVDVLDEDDTFEEIRVGQPLGIIQVPKWAGVNPADGRPMWYDADGNLTYTPNDVLDSEIYKDGLAEVNGGFGTNIGYKGFTLDVFFQFSFGKWAFANTDYFFTRTPDFLMNLDDIVLDRWRKPGDVTYFPRAVEGGADFPETANYRTQLSTASIYNASYIRLKTASLSYALPSSVTEALDVSGIRLYVSGLNLMTWTAWPFYDPEVADDTDDIFGNLVAASYPTGMRINGGIEIRF